VDIVVEVVYAEPHRAILKAFRLVPPATIEDALRLAAAHPEFAGVDIANSPVGVFGKLAATTQILKNHDRVEIYRPLAADPKNARRARARQARRAPKL
jgi:uncharacterized protein